MPLRKTIRLGPVYICIDANGMSWGVGRPPRRSRGRRSRANTRTKKRWMRKAWRWYQNRS
ncbi:MAG: hypothetical protein PPP56_00630 [Longimonas sp.]|uniref:hypothetical protein n=1 Tax=Longimonas sp. TaxID=2039626 RepID=UPI00334870A5